MVRVAKVGTVAKVAKVKGLQTVAGLRPEQPGVKAQVWADPWTKFLHQASAKLEMMRRRERQIAAKEARGEPGIAPMGRRYLEPPEHCDEFGSTAISDIAYNSALGRLTITFNTGRRYDYFNVSAQRYQAFCNAESKGRYFNQNIRHAYAYMRRG